MAEGNWDTLTRVWLDDAAAVETGDTLAVRERVRADSRRMSIAMLLEFAVGAALVCTAAWVLATRDGLDSFVLGFALLWFTAMALQFSSTNRRGLWQPASESTRAYIDLALERLRRRERALRFAWLLYVLEVVFLVAWYPATWFFWPLETWDLIEKTPRMLFLLALVTLGLVGWSTAVARRNRADRREFERLRRDLGAAD